MTYKEFAECARPELVGREYVGGVFGCPYNTSFKDGNKLLTRDCYHPPNTEQDCIACWNQAMDANETARAIEIYGSEWYLSALAYMEERKHDSTVQK